MERLTGDEERQVRREATDTAEFEAYCQYFEDRGYRVQPGHVFERQSGDESYRVSSFTVEDPSLETIGELDIVLHDGSVHGSAATVDAYLDGELSQVERFWYEEGTIHREPVYPD